MTMPATASLTDLAARLERQVGATSIGPITTRLLLRTGVNVRQPKPEQVNDRAIVTKVSAALAEMGYRL